MTTDTGPLTNLKSDLGGDIFIGGQFRGYPLVVHASEWARYGSGWVKSGWLWSPELAESHAVAFFKVHKREDGTGYIHLCDVANPLHTIFFETSTGFRQTVEIAWSQQPNAVLWHFTWQAYSVAAIRRLVEDAFTAQNLRSFCQDRSTFRPVLNRFGLNASLEDMAAALIDYCETRLLFPELVSEIGKDNPRQHELHFAEIYRI